MLKMLKTINYQKPACAVFVVHTHKSIMASSPSPVNTNTPEGYDIDDESIFG